MNDTQETDVGRGRKDGLSNGVVDNRYAREFDSGEGVIQRLQDNGHSALRGSIGSVAYYLRRDQLSAKIRPHLLRVRTGMRKSKGLPNLPSARARARISQSTLARMCGISREAISQFEHGAVDPSLDTCFRIVQALADRGLSASIEWLADYSPGGAYDHE